MSYAVTDKSSAKRQSYQKIDSGDNESESNPLTTGKGKKLKLKIETQLQSIQQKIKTLDDYHRQIGTTVDNHKFRQKIQQELVQTGAVIKQCGQEIKDYGDLNVPQQYIKQKRDQFMAFQDKQKQLTVKVQTVGSKIKEKQIQYNELDIQSAKASMVSYNGDTNAGDYMVDGITEEPEATKQLVLTQADLLIQGESDLLDNQIKQRKDDIDDIANIMSNINSIANDIAIETQNQGEKLMNVDEDMTEANKNAQDALNELNQAQVHNRKTGRCTYVLVGIILFCLVILGIILGTS